MGLCIDLFHSGWIRFDSNFKYVGVELLQKSEDNLWKDRGIEISELPVFIKNGFTDRLVGAPLWCIYRLILTITISSKVIGA